MILEIQHRTQYNYNQPVFAEPHHLYFYPAHGNYLTLRSFDIQVSPQPSGLAFRIDAENNPFHQCWFNYEISEMIIEVKFEVETKEINPFNFLVENDPKVDHTAALKLFLEVEPISTDLTNWANDILELSGSDPVTFLTFITKEIAANWTHNTRYEPTLMSPDKCFEQKNGSCRDLSWMMIQILRHLNTPSRFVSGYSFNPDLQSGHELHAWVETWLPGAGWIGLDPSAGILATDHYIPIATSHIPENTFPVQGTYRGQSPSSFDFEVSIKKVS